MTHQGPLFGVRVLDLSRLLPGPYCTQILCDLGAEVIKVEDFSGGDYARLYPPLMQDGNSAIFHALNRGKKSIQLDLKSPTDRTSFLSLLHTTDILLESFRPGVMAKLGLAPDDLLTKYPGLIICSISGYGQNGPDALRAGHDINYLAKSGVLGISENPSVLPVQVADIAGGSFPACIQILAALRQKERTGKGAVIDVSMTDNVYAMMMMPLARYDVEKKAFSSGSDLLAGGTPCYNVYRTSDGHISVGALEPKFWQQFCRVIERKDLVDRQFPQDPNDLKEVRDIVQGILEKKSNAQWRETFKSEDCCVEIVALPEEVAQQDAQLRSRALNVPIRFEDGTKLTAPSTPIRMTGVKTNTNPAPGMGQHTDEVLKVIRAKQATVENIKKIRAKL